MSGIVVFADGEVGRQAIDIILGYDASLLKGVVTLNGGNKIDCIPHLRSSDLGGISNLSPDIILLAWWPKIVGKDVLGLGQKVTLNFHPSYLPYCRGKDPNFWAIVEHALFGVSINHVDETIDGGPIAFRKEIPISWTDTGQSLYEKAKVEMVQLFKEVLPRIASLDIPRLPQYGGETHYRRELEEASRIDLNSNYSGRKILNMLRARTFEGHPACWFEENGEKYEVRIQIISPNKKGQPRRAGQFLGG